MIIRISNILGESLLFFISISILSILTFTTFIPGKNVVLMSTREAYMDGYRYGYKISYLTWEDGYVYLMNIGRNIWNITRIYLDGQIYNGTFEIYRGGIWIQSDKWLEGEILRIPYPYPGPNRVDLIILEKYVLHARR